ncbi:MAG: dihydrolipoyl dehydrogenase [Gemmatales bacterium]
MVIGDFKEQVDVVVVGGGPGGYAAAFHAADLGLDVALVEEDTRLGGTCLLRGCIPSKAMITAAEKYHQLSSLSKMGISIEGKVNFDIKKLAAWRNNILKELTGGLDNLSKVRNIRRFEGRGYLCGPNELKIAASGSSLKIQFKRAILALGSRVFLPKPFVRSERVITSDEATNIDYLPSSILVVGGGYIGMELGGCFASLGTKVTVVEMLDHLLPGTDADMTRFVKKNMEARGVQFLLESKVTEVVPGKDSVKVTIAAKDGKTSTTEFDRVLVCVGRTPNTDDFGLETQGIKMEKGFIQVNAQCQTSVPHIYAIGDCTGQPMLAHRAHRMGGVAAEVLAGKKSAFDNRTIPAVIFTDPEIAYCGLSEEDAKAAGFEVAVGKMSFAASGRAKSMDAQEGFVKVIAEKGTDVVLGVRMVGPHVSEMLGMATLAVENGLTVEDITATIHAHPTLAETFLEATEAVHGMAVHAARPRSAAKH